MKSTRVPTSPKHDVRSDVIFKAVRVVKETTYASDENRPSTGRDFGSGSRLHRRVRNNWGGDFPDSYGPRKPPQMDEMAEEREWTGGTQNRFKSSLSTVFREGLRAGKVSINPARLIRRSKESQGRVRFLSYEEEAELRKAIAATLPGRIKDEGESAFAQLDVAYIPACESPSNLLPPGSRSIWSAGSSTSP